jgi:anti-sigma B factor antagonist
MNAATPEDGRQSATLAVEHLDHTVVLRIGGELDMLTVPDLQTRLSAATAGTASSVIIDLTDVRFLGSTALNLLISMHTDLAAENRPLRLVTGEGGVVVRPLQITGLDRLLDLHPNLPAALGATRAFRR